MDIRHFREQVLTQFGRRMEHATPANVRDFLDRIYTELANSNDPVQPIIIPREDARDYEQVVNAFLARVLDIPPERAILLLWLFAGEIYYARLGEQYQEMGDLLRFDVSE